MDIEDWRQRIDEIDKDLVRLLNDRSQCAIEIGRLKKKLRLRVYDPEREDGVIRKVRSENHGPLDSNGLQRLFERIIDECRRIERVASESGGDPPADPRSAAVD